MWEFSDQQRRQKLLCDSGIMNFPDGAWFEPRKIRRREKLFHIPKGYGTFKCMLPVSTNLYSQHRQRQLCSGFITSFDYCYLLNYACSVFCSVYSSWIWNFNFVLEPVSPSFWFSLSQWWVSRVSHRGQRERHTVRVSTEDSPRQIKVIWGW